MKKIFLATILLPSIAAYAQDDCCSYFLQAEGGISLTRCTEICANPILWDTATQGYNAKLRHAPMVGIAFGYLLNNWFAMGVSIDHRSAFRYCKFQTVPAGSTTPSFLGTKTRVFDLDNSSFMLDFMVNKIQRDCCYSVDTGFGNIVPYIGFGFGLSKTTVYNFHSVVQSTLTSGAFSTQPVRSIMSPNTTNKLGWKFQAGIEFSGCDCLFIGINYRYFDAGKFRSNNYILDTSDDFSQPFAAPAWCGKLRAHEIFGTLSLEF